MKLNPERFFGVDKTRICAPSPSRMMLLSESMMAARLFSPVRNWSPGLSKLYGASADALSQLPELLRITSTLPAASTIRTGSGVAARASVVGSKNARNASRNQNWIEHTNNVVAGEALAARLDRYPH